jgi:hypothetical protein
VNLRHRRCGGQRHLTWRIEGPVFTVDFQVHHHDPPSSPARQYSREAWPILTAKRRPPSVPAAQKFHVLILCGPGSRARSRERFLHRCILL